MLKALMYLAFLGGIVWFGATVPLGSRTLFGHLHAIVQTKESQELLRGTRERALPLVDDVRRRLAGDEGEAATAEAGGGPKRPAAEPPRRAPAETLTAADRKKLRDVAGAPSAQ